MKFFATLVSIFLICFLCYGVADAYFGWGVPGLYSQRESIQQASSSASTYPNSFVYVGGSSYRGHPRGGGIHSGK